MPTILAEVQWDAFLKELYPEGVPLEIMQRRHLLMSKLDKQGEAVGEYIVVPVTVDGPSGRGATIASMMDPTTGSIGPHTSRKFNVTLARDYAAAWIDELTIRKAATDRGAFVATTKFEIDGLIRQLGNSMGHALYRAGDGTVGRGDGAYSVAGNVITLQTKSDTKYFGIGMVLDFIPNSGGAPSGAARAIATQRARVTKIDEDAGTVTAALDVTGAAVVALSTNYTSVANTDWIAPLGDYNQNYATTGALKIRGLAAWIPLTAPTGGDNFYGVDRSEFVTRLAGNRLSDSAAPAEDSIMALAEVMHDRGANPDFVVVSARQFTKISKRMTSKVEFESAGGEAGHGFMKFFVATSAGILPVYADPDCPEDRGYILTLSTWKIRHLGLPEVVKTDGLSMLRRIGLDQVEIRCRYYAQLVCLAPGENGVFAVA